MFHLFLNSVGINILRTYKILKKTATRVCLHAVNSARGLKEENGRIEREQLKKQTLFLRIYNLRRSRASREPHKKPYSNYTLLNFAV